MDRLGVPDFDISEADGVLTFDVSADVSNAYTEVVRLRESRGDTTAPTRLRVNVHDVARW